MSELFEVLIPIYVAMGFFWAYYSWDLVQAFVWPLFFIKEVWKKLKS